MQGSAADWAEVSDAVSCNDGTCAPCSAGMLRCNSWSTVISGAVKNCAFVSSCWDWGYPGSAGQT